MSVPIFVTLYPNTVKPLLEDPLTKKQINYVSTMDILKILYYTRNNAFMTSK